MPPKRSFTSPGRCTGWSGSRSHNSRTIRSSWIPGAGFNADLRRPLDFGAEPPTPAGLEHIGTPPPSGSMVHAVLVTPLGSAPSKKGDAVEAVIIQPLRGLRSLVSSRGKPAEGFCTASAPARRFSRNGQLRIVFHQVVPPTGIQQTVEASLEGVAVEKGEHLSLDSEGGAQVTTLKTRYLTTAISVLLASSSMADHDRDAGFHGADG